MSHKVHPKIYRAKGTDDWQSKGFYHKNYPLYLEEDYHIRQMVEKKLDKMAVEQVEIRRFPEKITIVISSARPGLIIGRGGEGAEKIKKDIKKMLNSTKEINVEIKEVRNPWVSAALSAQWIQQQLERRVPYKRVLKQILDKIIANKEVKGARIEVAGRLDGVEIARREWVKKGQLPRQTIRADIDYAQKMARCSFGAIGIKVWIYKGEKFER